MTAISRWMDRVLLVILGMLIVIDGCLFIYVRANYPTDDPRVLYRFANESGPVAPPAGFTSKGVRASVETANATGWAIRYAALHCGYCRKDEPLWNPLKTDLQRLGYSVIVIVPHAEDEFPTSSLLGASQEVYVDMEWIRHFRLESTPTLLIFDAKRGLIWSHEGTLNPADPARAITTINYWMRNR